MIKNVILDISGVLVDFDWRKRFLELGVPPEKVDYLADATFHSKEWVAFDKGTESDENVLKGLLANAPGDEALVMEIWNRVSKAVKQRDYAKPWITFLQEHGYKVILLSNYPGKIYEETKKELDFDKMADGVFISYREKLVKPDREIYETVLERFSITAEESVFIDDTPVNLTAPAEMGMKTIQFKTFAQVQEELQKMGVPVLEYDY